MHDPIASQGLDADWYVNALQVFSNGVLQERTCDMADAPGTGLCADGGLTAKSRAYVCEDLVAAGILPTITRDKRVAATSARVCSCATHDCHLAETRISMLRIGMEKARLPQGQEIRISRLSTFCHDNDGILLTPHHLQTSLLRFQAKKTLSSLTTKG